jgi:hypothetical protein
MSIVHIAMKNWKAECPKCHHIEHSEEFGTKCNNCGAPAKMTFGNSNSGWTDSSARQSWRQMQCTNNCGWAVNRATCSKCGTTIQGDWFKGDAKWCFVATAAFNDQDHPTVDQLRRVRDERLVKTKLGRSFVEFYYTHGELLAKVVNLFPSIKPTIRLMLTWLGRALTK